MQIRPKLLIVAVVISLVVTISSVTLFVASLPEEYYTLGVFLGSIWLIEVVIVATILIRALRWQ